jgi:hypothetical protein
MRLEADFTIQSREWDVWKFTQWIVQFYNDENLIKTNFIRLQRLLKPDQTQIQIYFDVKVPKEKFTKCVMTLWNADSPQTIIMDNFEAACFNK